MTATNLANPNDVPVDALRSLTTLSAEQREFAKAYLECSDDLRVVVHSMFAVLDNKDATDEERFRALTTIADALYLNPQLAREAQRIDQQEQTFAQRLRELLDRKRVSQTELAKRTGCSQSAISHMLNRNSRPQKKTILKLAEALQVEPVELWPDLEVAAILDQVTEFQEERQLTTAQAASLREALDRPAASVQAQRLPSRQSKR